MPKLITPENAREYQRKGAVVRHQRAQERRLDAAIQMVAAVRLEDLTPAQRELVEALIKAAKDNAA